MKKLLCLMGGAMLSLHLLAQVEKPLEIGDTLPDVVLHQVLNYKSSSLPLSELKGKVIIFDFWATWCGACIEGLPHLEALQNEFRDQLQVIAVTDQDREQISSFFSLKAHNNLKGLSFPFITTDSILHTLLGVNGAYPFQVWIDKSGIIVGRTDANEATEKNIRKLLNNKVPDFNNKLINSEPIFSIKDHPLISAAPVGKILYSSFSGFFDRPVGNGLQKSVDSINHIIRYDLINSSLILMASWALNLSHPLTAKECDLFVKDTSSYFYANDLSTRDAWNREHTFSFETVVPQKNSLKLAKENLLKELDSYLGIRASLVDKLVTCLVIKDKEKQNAKQIARSHYYESNLKKDAAGNFSYSLVSSSLGSLAILINRTKIFSKWPLVVNESKGKRTLQLNIGNHPDDISRWRKELERFGLQLVPEQRTIIMLQIKEDNKPSFQLN